MSRLSSRFDSLLDSLNTTDENVSDLVEDVADIKLRLDDLEDPDEDDEDSDDESEDSGALVDWLADIRIALANLTNITAAAAVMAHSGPYADDGFPDDLRKAAKRVLEQRVRYGMNY